MVGSKAHFYQLGMREMCLVGPKIALCFPRLLVCVTALIMRAKIMSHTLLPCDYILVNMMDALQLEYNTGKAATTSSLTQLRVWHTEKQMQCGHEDNRDWKCPK